jgi:hypothetical protein
MDVRGEADLFPAEAPPAGDLRLLGDAIPATVQDVVYKAAACGTVRRDTGRLGGRGEDLRRRHACRHLEWRYCLAARDPEALLLFEEDSA